MIGFYIHLISILGLYVAALIGRILISKNSNLRRITKVSHFVLFVLNISIFLGYFLVFFYPGLAQVEQALGLGKMNLPFFLRMPLGFILLGFGVILYYITVSLLMNKGNGFSAYKFTEKVVTNSIYNYIRHPMSLGYYLFALGFPFIFDSLYLLLITLLGFIPAQLFYVFIYEEKELEYRFSDDYKKYRKSVSFIIPKLFIKN